MKKKSIISSLTAAAVILPALNHANTINPPQELNKTETDSSVAKESPELCVAPYVKKGLDLKVVKIFTVEASGSDKTAEAVGAVAEPLALKGVDPANPADPTAVPDATATDASTDAAVPEAAYDPHSIYGADSRIFTRLTKPVQNLFADIMFAQNDVLHQNRRYNLIPARPDPMINTRTLNGYFEIPVNEKMDIKAAIGRDAVTAVSPIYYTLIPTSEDIANIGNARQVVTGPSIMDQRNEAAVSLNLYGEKATSKIEVGGSREYDYRSTFIGGEVDIDFNNKNSTLNLGSSFTENRVIPDQLGAPFPRIGGRNSSWQALVGLTNIIDNKSLAQFVITWFLERGYLNDPYKPNELPDSRKSWAFAGKYIRYFPSYHEAGWHLDYRYYTDNWSVQSSTIKSTLRLDLINGWGVEPGVRYYSQRGTKFYNLFVPLHPVVVPPDVYYTSDYRFSSYGQVAGMLEVNKQFSASHTAYIGGSYGIRNAALRLGGSKVTYPTESEFTKIRISMIYVGIKGLY